MHLLPQFLKITVWRTPGSGLQHEVQVPHLPCTKTTQCVRGGLSGPGFRAKRPPASAPVPPLTGEALQQPAGEEPRPGGAETRKLPLLVSCRFKIKTQVNFPPKIFKSLPVNLNQQSANFFWEGLDVHILGFAGPSVFVTNCSALRRGVRAAVDST